LPMICVMRRKPVSGSLYMMDLSRLSYNGAILIYPIRERVEFGFMKTKFGNALLLHAGYKRGWDFCKYLTDGFA
jgi:hypothetical protein